jgi:hypothetical protein
MHPQQGRDRQAIPKKERNWTGCPAQVQPRGRRRRDRNSRRGQMLQESRRSGQGRQRARAQRMRKRSHRSGHSSHPRGRRHRRRGRHRRRHVHHRRPGRLEPGQGARASRMPLQGGAMGGPAVAVSWQLQMAPRRAQYRPSGCVEQLPGLAGWVEWWKRRWASAHVWLDARAARAFRGHGPREARLHRWK